MRKKRKRLWSTILSVGLIVGMLPTNVVSASELVQGYQGLVEDFKDFKDEIFHGGNADRIKFGSENTWGGI
mgnify:CR=1 FL=1